MPESLSLYDRLNFVLAELSLILDKTNMSEMLPLTSRRLTDAANIICEVRNAVKYLDNLGITTSATITDSKE